MGFIYLINESGTSNYKIGVTKARTINRRKLELQTGNSNELILCRSFETDYPYKLEKMLHNHYHKTRMVGEWFELTDDEAIDFTNVCEKYLGTINYLLVNNEFYN